MEFKRTIVIYKRSRFERDLEGHGCSAGELVLVYRHWGLAPERIRDSDERQQQARTKLAKLLPEAKFIPAEEATRGEVNNAALVVALGGDNHFQRVARLLKDEPLAGINSDPATSLGMLTTFNIETFKQTLPKLLAGALPVEAWTRLEVHVDGKALSHLALCEVFVGERDRCVMSRHVLHLRGRSEEQKSSGLLLVTGAGSTGWYQSAASRAAAGHDSFPQNSPSFRFLLSEPHQKRAPKHSLLTGDLQAEERLRIVSLNRRKGIVALDAFQQRPLRQGATVEVAIGRALRVVTSGKKKPA